MGEVFKGFTHFRVQQRFVEQIFTEGFPGCPAGQGSAALRGADFHKDLQDLVPGQSSTTRGWSDLRGGGLHGVVPGQGSTPQGGGLQSAVPGQGSTARRGADPKEIFKASSQDRVQQLVVEMIVVLVGEAMSCLTAVCTGTMYSLARRRTRTRCLMCLTTREPSLWRSKPRCDSLLGSSLAGRANASSTTESARMALVARSLMMRLSSILMRGWDDGLDLAVRHVQSWSWSTSP